MVTHRIHQTLVVGFCLFLSLPLALMLIGAGTSDAGTENRVLAPAPEIPTSVQNLEEWPGSVENFFNDRFGMRNHLIQVHNRIKLDWFQVSPTDKVVIGRDGWLYFSDSVYQEMPQDSALFDRHYQRWQARHDRLAAGGIPYLFVVVPCKKGIYPEYLPHDIALDNTDTSGLYVREMEARGADFFLDLGPALRARKGDGPLYFRNDSHWNFYGSLLGYRAIADRVTQMVPGQTMESFDMPWKLSHCEGGGLARMLGFPKALKERTYMWPEWSGWCAWSKETLAPYREEPLPDFRKPQVWECLDQDLKVLVIHDSFMTAMRFYLAQNFGRTVFVWDYLDEATLDQLIEQEQPDLVIEEHVIRMLLHRP